MVSISLRASRLSYDYISATGVFVINATTEKIARATDYCGVRGGRNEDKFKKLGLSAVPGPHTGCMMLEDSPVCIECEVTEKKELGSHTMFLANVLAVHVDDQYLDANARFDFQKAGPIVYSHGEYRGLGRYLGKFGYSVAGKRGNRKKEAAKSKAAKYVTGKKKEGKRRRKI